jgi:IMP dehydrogenase/GMP reductase
MASKEAQMAWRGKAAAAEGVVGSVKYVGVLEDYIGEIAGNIRSGCSYTGVFNLSGLHTKARFEIISHASQYESKPHILTRD